MRSVLEAKLFGMALGDGWLSQSYTKDTMYYQFGFSGDESSLVNVKNNLISLYGDIGKALIRTEETHSPKYDIKGWTSQFYCNQKVAGRFEKLGMPIGKRVETEWLIPEWIMQGSQGVKTGFLSGFYSAEGYTPKMQKNDITIKALGFKFHKRARLEENYWQIVHQFKDILDSLSIEYNFFKKEAYTCDYNLVAEFIISNNHSNAVHFLTLLDLDYCVHKDEERKLMLSYYKEKDKVLSHLSKAIEDSKNPLKTPKEIAAIYGIRPEKVYKWRARKTIEAKLPNDFIKYTDFKRQTLSLI
jgi:hypothetical protein